MKLLFSLIMPLAGLVVYSSAGFFGGGNDPSNFLGGSASSLSQLVDKVDPTKVLKGIEAFSIFEDKSKLPQRKFTWQEVSKADGRDGRPLYIVVNKKVYDITAFVKYHPGGEGVLLRVAGRDATAAITSAGMPTYVLDVVIHRFKVGTVE